MEPLPTAGGPRSRGLRTAVRVEVDPHQPSPRGPSVQLARERNPVEGTTEGFPVARPGPCASFPQQSPRSRGQLQG